MQEPSNVPENDAEDARLFRALIAHCDRVDVKVDPKDKEKIVGMVFDIRQQTQTFSLVQRKIRTAIEDFVGALEK